MKVTRITKGNWGKTRAYFDITTDEGFIIKGCRLMQGTDNLFIGMPFKQDDGGNFKDIVLADKDLKMSILNEVMPQYKENQAVKENVVENADDDLPF